MSSKRECQEQSVADSSRKRRRHHRANQQDTTLEQISINHPTSEEPDCLNGKIEDTYTPFKTVRDLVCRMKYFIEYVEGLLDTQKNHSSELINDLYGTCFSGSIKNVFAQEFFDMNTLVGHDSLHDAMCKAKAVLGELKEAEMSSFEFQYRDMHMRKAPVTTMGYIGNPDEKNSILHVVSLYMNHPVWWVNNRFPILDCMDLVDTAVREVNIDNQYRTEILSIAVAKELILLLFVLLWVYVYQPNTKWPSCEQIADDKERNTLFNIHHLKSVFHVAQTNCKWFVGAIKRMKSDKRVGTTSSGLSRRIYSVISETKENRIKLALLSGLIKPAPGKRNQILRCMATACLMREHDKIMAQKPVVKDTYVITDEQKKHFVTKTEEDNLLSIMGYDNPDNSFLNFLSQRERQLESVQNIDNRILDGSYNEHTV